MKGRYREVKRHAQNPHKLEAVKLGFDLHFLIHSSSEVGGTWVRTGLKEFVKELTDPT